jgi:hypothetical protein
MTKKIAPTLSTLILGMGQDGDEHGVACDRELRALLAVARAAERHLAAEHYPYGASEAPSTNALWRVVIRLARLSGSRRGGGR